MSDSRVVAQRGHAKVNLMLAVGAPIAAPSAFAGYHPIASWMASVDLYDDIEVEVLGKGEASRYVIEWAPDAPRPSPIDWPVEKDLAARAHRLLEAEAGRALPVSLRVRKRIPVGGGLGGGSADGAATMLGIREAFRLEVPISRLAELSMKLGSDVAFFLDEHVPARGAIVSHLGEQIERVPAVAQPIVLFFPAFGCPTGAVYRAFDGASSGEGFGDRVNTVERVVRDSTARGAILTDDLFNDLAAPACRVEPQLRELIDRLAGMLNARIHVTGSGSTLFALAETPAQAEQFVRQTNEAVGAVTAIATKVM